VSADYHAALTHGRRVTLSLEPGSEPPIHKYRLAFWSADGLQQGGFTATTWQLLELFLALERFRVHVERAGWPGE
jgi:hypothetical protein